MFSVSGIVDLNPNLDGLQMFNFNHIRIVTSKRCPQKKKPPITRLVGGGLGGGPAEYPAVHLKEAILIPIVLPALAALHCYIVGMHMCVHCTHILLPPYPSLLLAIFNLNPPTPWGENHTWQTTYKIGHNSL